MRGLETRKQIMYCNEAKLQIVEKECSEACHSETSVTPSSFYDKSEKCCGATMESWAKSIKPLIKTPLRIRSLCQSPPRQPLPGFESMVIGDDNSRNQKCKTKMIPQELYDCLVDENGPGLKPRKTARESSR
mmetsp:Transcript_11168/g.19077  ORF Transcript_11168/g.19077 Transcript_11168/m.19077 type:complete len:132 (-) Transcript_11168:33-428(-)